MALTAMPEGKSNVGIGYMVNLGPLKAKNRVRSPVPILRQKMKIKVHAHPATMFLASQGLISTPRQTLTKLVIREGVARLDPSIISVVETQTKAFLAEIEQKVSDRLKLNWRFGDADEIAVGLVSERSSAMDAHHLVQVYLLLVNQQPPAFKWQILTIPFVPDHQTQHQMMVDAIVDDLSQRIIQASMLSTFAEGSASE